MPHIIMKRPSGSVLANIFLSQPQSHLDHIQITLAHINHPTIFLKFVMVFYPIGVYNGLLDTPPLNDFDISKQCVCFFYAYNVPCFVLVHMRFKLVNILLPGYFNLGCTLLSP